MTFEQKLKEMLKADLNAMFGPETEHNRQITVANDMSTKALEKPNSMLAVIKTGQGIRTAVPGYDTVSLSLFIEFYFDRNFAQTFLGEMQDYIGEHNGKTYSATIDSVLTYYRINFNNPTVSQTALDQAVQNRTMQFSQVILMGEVFYSTVVSLIPPVARFEYLNDGENSTLYDIKNILRYSKNKTPSFESVQYNGHSTTKKEVMGYETTHEIEVLHVNNDEFLGFIRSDFDQQHPMNLTIDGKNIPIQTVTISEIYTLVDNVRAITCVFSE